MRRLLLVAALALLALAAPAGAHPLGNFSVNHLTVVRVSSDRVDVRYVLDQAEIPTFQERGLPPARVLARKRADVARGVTLTVGGRPVALTLRPGGRLSFPRGAGGLHTTRVEVLLSARVAPRGRSWCATPRSPVASAGAPSSPSPAAGRRCAAT